MSIAKAAAAPAAATSEESLWVIPAAPVLDDAAADDDAEAEDEALSVVALSAVEAAVEVESVLVAAEASVPVLVPVSVELEEVEVELELAPVEQTTAVGRSVTPPRAQRDLATLRVAIGRSAGECGCGIAHHVLSWSSLEHLSATQHETSLKKDLASQMHLKSMPHSLGMAPVAQSFYLGLV